MGIYDTVGGLTESQYINHSEDTGVIKSQII